MADNAILVALSPFEARVLSFLLHRLADSKTQTEADRRVIDGIASKLIKELGRSHVKDYCGQSDDPETPPPLHP